MSIIQNTKKAIRVFLSYALKDEKEANKIQRFLSKYHNIRIFSPKMLNAGELWRDKLRDEISQCDLFIVLLSPDSIDSNWVLTELGAAWALDKTIIPVYTKPEMLSKIPVELKSTESLDISSLEEHPEILNNIIENYKENILSNL